MKLLLIGSTGKTGQYIRYFVEQKGIQTKLFVRTLREPGPNIVIGDVRDQKDVNEAMTGVDGVICSLNTESNGTLISGMSNVIEAMIKYKVKRLVTIGTAGILQSVLQPELLRYQSIENKRTNHEAAMEHHQVYTKLMNTSLDWTIICPTRLVQDEQSGHYRVQKNVLPSDGSKISFMDTAEFAVSEYFDRSFVRERVGICY
ncbi:NAD(P)-dependent oxidoreductase [Paenibacillus prosopidis]|uniref:Putative NADH-flavin reductase n=1 Tax=Paenibacillus prosopidis TaxID=630520 RepID=A0A368VLA9_9BACL|nr:NAD(P)-binding oxidoreductase [Paenibacillus prosopidis]RCW42308.1 putative NADH-flavin reductase [Paenibacillus prosopidis]